MQVFDGVVSKLAALELDNGDGPIGSHQKPTDYPVELHQLLQLGLLGPEVKVFYYQYLLAPLAQVSALLEEYQVEVVLHHPLFGLLDHLGLGNGHS